MSKKDGLLIPRVTDRRKRLEAKRAAYWLVYNKHSSYTFRQLAAELETSTARVSHIANGRWSQVRVNIVEAAILRTIHRLESHKTRVSAYELRELDAAKRKLIQAARHLDALARSIARRRGKAGA